MVLQSEKADFRLEKEACRAYGCKKAPVIYLEIANSLHKIGW